MKLAHAKTNGGKRMSADRGDASVRPQSATSTEVVGREQYMALLAALLGWLFDGAEMGVFSMVGRPAIKDLLKTTDEATIGIHFSIIMASFLVGAATGGVLFGWLGDRIGRVRAMTFSILTYALFTGLCGVVGSVGQLGVLRFIASLGMGGEWALGRGAGDGNLAQSLARVHGGPDWRISQRRLHARGRDWHHAQCHTRQPHRLGRSTSVSPKIGSTFSLRAAAGGC